MTAPDARVPSAAPTLRPWHTGGVFDPGTPNPTTAIYGATPPGMQSGRCVARFVRLADAGLIVASANHHEELVAALRRLTNEAAGLFDLNPDGLRDLFGSTNVAVLAERIAAARAALAKVTAAAQPEGDNR